MNVLPEHWSIDMMDYEARSGQKEARVFSSSVPVPRGVVGFIPGWKTSPAEKIDALESFRKAGYIVMSVGLENPGMETGSLDDSLNRINSFVFDPESPLYQTFDEDLPRFVVTHSTSGMLFQHALLEARRNDQDMPDIRHAYHTAPFFDTAGSSLLFHPIKNRIYTGHAMRHMNELAGTPLMDRLYYYYRGLSHRLREENPIDRPTHGQILEIAAYGAGYLSYKNAELKSGKSVSTPEQTYIISTDDSFSCPKTAEHSAGLAALGFTDRQPT